jgi:hypothetical protein
MPQLFLNRRSNKKYVRPIRRNAVSHKIDMAEENNTPKEVKMENLQKVKELVGKDTKVPKRKVKVEKKEKGLIERTEESTILLTEDNKMMLTD